MDDLDKQKAIFQQIFFFLVVAKLTDADAITIGKKGIETNKNVAPCGGGKGSAVIHHGDGRDKKARWFLAFCQATCSVLILINLDWISWIDSFRRII